MSVIDAYCILQLIYLSVLSDLNLPPRPLDPITEYCYHGEYSEKYPTFDYHQHYDGDYQHLFTHYQHQPIVINII